MSERLPTARVQAALPDWRVLVLKAHATFRTPDYATGARFTAGIAELAEAADHHPDVLLRYGEVAVDIHSHDVGGLTSRDIRLGERISALAAELGLTVDTAAPQVTEVCFDAMDIGAVKEFWKALLGYDEPMDNELVDPRGPGFPVWFQQLDEPRPQRNRIHFDVWVPHDQGRARVDAALAAGGRLVSDEHAPAFWILADPEGNEACVCTWQYRDPDAPTLASVASE